MKKIVPFLLLIWMASCGDDSTTTPIIDDPITEIPTDRWWNDEVFYEIFVRSFYDSDGDGIGDFQGIIQKLDYLNDGDPNTDTDLGITGIWLMPMMPSPSYHGYDVTDFRDVNPQYGTMDDFRQFLDAAHQRGIKVIIDFVINHTSTEHPWFQNSAGGTTAERRLWYIWEDNDPGFLGPWGQGVWHERNGDYYYGVFWSGMPDLNYQTPAVTNEIKDITRFWYEDIGVDGFRIDAAKHLVEEGQNQENTLSTLNWWRSFYNFQKNIDPALMTVGEVWTSTANVIPYSDERLDYCFEFDLATLIVNAARFGSASSLENKIDEVVNSYNENQYGTFLTNHDQERVMNQLEEDVDKAKVAAAIYLTLPGVPYLYYGEEVGMLGLKPDEFIRTPMQWSPGANGGFSSGTPWIGLNSNFASFNVETMQADPNSLWSHYRNLIHARTSSPALSGGNIELIDSTDGALLSFLRTGGDESVLVVHNLDVDALQDVAFSMGSSSLASGSYNVEDLISGNMVGSLDVEDNGSFSGFIPYSTLDGQSVYLLKFIRQ